MKKILVIIILILLSFTTFAAVLEGSIYGSNLDLEKDVLIEVNSIPQQQILSKDGTYKFNLPLGDYTLIARKGFTEVEEKINIVKDGTFTFDIFLLDSLSEEDQLWQETNENLFDDEVVEINETNKYNWRHLVAAIIVMFALFRFGKAWRKYGKLPKFRKAVIAETNKTVAQHKAEIAAEPGFLDQALEIIKKNDGRLTQKKLRREMLPLSEAKVSLIVTELEHKGKVEKVKKGRGNVIILKDTQ